MVSKHRWEKKLKLQIIKSEKLFFRISTIKQALPVVFEQCISSLAFFGVGALCARAVDKESFGLYVLGSSIILIIVGFERALVTTPFAILYPGKQKTETNYYIGDMFVLHILFTIAVIFIIIVGYLLWEVKQGRDEKLVLAILVAVIGQSFYFFLKFVLLATLQSNQNLLLGFVFNTVLICFTSFLFLSNLLDTISLFMVIGVSTLFVSCFFSLPLFRNSNFSLQNFKTTIRKHWSIGRWIVGSNVAFIFSSQMFPWLLAYFSTQTDVADFGATMGVTRILTPLTQGFSSFLLPKLSHIRKSKENFANAMITSVVLAAALAITLLIAGFFFGEILCVLLYSEKYSGLGLLISLSFVIQGLNIVNIPIDTGLNALKRTDQGFKSLVFSSILAILVGIPLTRGYGVLGACIGSLVAVAGGFVYRMVSIKVIMKNSVT